jgi:cell division protein FtsZ
LQRFSQAHEYARIRVVGIGGGGIAAVNDMIHCRIFGVELLTADTAESSTTISKALAHIELDHGITNPGGSRGDATAAFQAASMAEKQIADALSGSDIVFILAGLGGGTGSGAAPVVAGVAKQQRALVIGIVTYPFSFEGETRLSAAKKSVDTLRGCTDTLIVIPNDRLLQQSQGTIGFHETYSLAHNIWRDSIRGISELINRSGLINVDFADVRTIMKEGGAAIIGTGEATGKGRARVAAERASRSDMLGITLDGARGLLFNIVGGPDLTLLEVEEAAEVLTRRTHPHANVIIGATIDDSLDQEVRITAVATGFGLRKVFNQQVQEDRARSSWNPLRRTAERIHATVPA